MPNIIEKEIMRRETLIVSKREKEDRVLELQLELERLNAEIAETDERTLVAEIEELRTYLPREDVDTERVDNETVAVPTGLFI